MDSKGTTRNAVEFKGTLTKRGRLNKSWKVRTFTLYKLGWLVYAESSAAPQKGRVLVAHCSCAVDTTHGRPAAFSITSADGDSLILQAGSDAERDDWMRQVRVYRGGF